MAGCLEAERQDAPAALQVTAHVCGNSKKVGDFSNI
jgi:hypothetical protein